MKLVAGMLALGCLIGCSGCAGRPSGAAERLSDKQYLAIVRPLLARHPTATGETVTDADLLSLRDSVCRRYKSMPGTSYWQARATNIAAIWAVSVEAASAAQRAMARSGCPEMIKDEPGSSA